MIEKEEKETKTTYLGPNSEEITVEDVRELRRKTGYGMMDCLKALRMCGKDERKLLDYLQGNWRKYLPK